MLHGVIEGEVLLGEDEGDTEWEVPQGEAQGGVPQGEQGDLYQHKPGSWITFYLW